MQRSRGRNRWLGCIASTAVVLGVAAGCVRTSNSESPGLDSSGSPSSSASPSATASPSPSTTPQPTPPAPGEPWGGLVWSAPVTVDFPWGHAPRQVLSWHDEFLAIDTVGSDRSSGEVLIGTSADLISWTVLSRGTDAPTAGLSSRWIVAGPSQLVAFGLTGGDFCWVTGNPFWPVGSTCNVSAIWTSADAVTWESVDVSPFKGARLLAVSGGAKGLVAVGSAGWQKPVIWFSDTGLTWRRLSLTSSVFKAANLANVTAVPDGFVAVGTIGAAAPPSVSDEGTFVPDHIGPAGAWWSSDGQTWHVAPVDQAEADPFQVVVTAHGLLAMGEEGPADAPRPRAWTSADGRAWAARMIHEGDGSKVPGMADFDCWPVSDGVRVICLEPDVEATGGTRFEVWESLDGATWHRLRLEGEVPSFDDMGWNWTLVVRTDEIAVIGQSQPVVVSAAAVP